MSNGSTVLVVDDDRGICELIRAALADKGYRTVLAGNGREALEYLKSPAPKPKLILLDLMMPVMTGWEFRAVQQADPELSRIPVAIITGRPVKGGAEGLGAVDVLYKPSRVEKLTAVVSRFCDN